MLRSLATCLVALSFSGAAFGLDCPAPEKKGQTPGGYTICKPSTTGQCGPGRKHTRHERELVPMCVDGGPAKVQAKPAAVASKCPAGEDFVHHRGYDVCKPRGGVCGKGRRNVPHHRFPDLIICENDPHAATRHGPEITCKEYERPYQPNNKSLKAFCEPTGGRCGSLRVAVASDVPGKKMCIDR